MMKMHRCAVAVVLVVLVGLTPAAWSWFKAESAGAGMTEAAARLVEALNPKQRQAILMELDSPKRLDWHFIPKATRKGLQVKEMTEAQRKLCHDLLRSALSELGYGKTTQIMELESVLHFLEKGQGQNIRDPLRYYLTIFGQPRSDARWALSFEGHHLSLNFVVERDAIVSSTPQFFGANPATVKDDYIPQVKKGTRVLAKEEQLAFDLVRSLDAEQAKAAILADKAPREIRAAGEAQPPTDPPAGLVAEKMNDKQVKLLRSLVDEYARAMPYEVAAERLAAIEKAGYGKIHFAWAGAMEPGIGHYYRVEGPTFLIEFVNTQPDGAGNLANHIHCVWRDTAGDFGIPLKR